ncbi:MAG: HEAT repeat domain-containing protein [Planctomycetota bacterium]
MLVKQIQGIALFFLVFMIALFCLLSPKDPQQFNKGNLFLDHFNQPYQNKESLHQNGKNVEPVPNFRLPNQKQVEILIRRLARTGDSRQRLLEMKEEAVPYLCAALLNPDRFASPYIRRECAVILGELTYPSSARYLILAMKQDSDIFVQLGCISSLAKIRSPEAIEPMRAHFSSNKNNIFIRSALAIALAEAGDHEMVPRFKRLVEEPLKITKPYQKSKDRYLIWHLREALKILTGEPNTYYSESVKGSGIFSHPETPK